MKATVGVVLFLLSFVARPAMAQETHLVVVTGVEGDQESAELFHKWATTLIDAAAKGGVPAANVTYLAEKPDRDPARIRARSTRENVQKTLADLAVRVRPDDEVVLVLFGHGSFDGHQASFNLPGPDLSAADYAALLAKFPSARVAFVNTSSSSGAFLEPLAAPGRTVITATTTGGERNETRFPAYFVEAFADATADKNRDGRVSMQEAFEYARAKVAQTYAKEGLILTEHPVLQDGNEGRLAATLFLEGRATAVVARTGDPELRALLEQQRQLEDAVAALKLRQPQMPAAQYDAEMEKLLTDLALKSRAIREREARK